MTTSNDEYKDISRRLAALEQHVINLIVPIQGIAHNLDDPGLMRDLREIFGKPLLIDDRKLALLLTEFKQVMATFSESIQAHALTDLLKTLNELKFRFYSMEMLIKDIYKNQNTSYEIVINGERYLKSQPQVEEKSKVKKKAATKKKPRQNKP